LTALHPVVLTAVLLLVRQRSEPAAWAILAVWSCVGVAAAWGLQAARRQALQQERMRAMGRLASGVAHEFNNALSPIIGFTDLLLRHPELPQETTRRYVHNIHMAAQDTAAVIRRLRELYGERRRELELGPVDLRACIADVVALTRPYWSDEALGRGAHISVQTEVGALPLIRGDAASIRQMLTSLVINAVEAMPEGGTLTLRARPEPRAVRLEVSDTGIGMTQDVRERCLDPLFSTKGRRGTGLGLCLVHVTVARHGGTLTLHTAPGRGTTVVARLPRQLSAIA
jgi:signal transduction histidine kinase